MSKSVRVRFAPSPTGYLHVGGARTALFNWLHARQSGGSFILRLEDTDEARNTPEARRTIFDGLRWLGLDPDEGPEEGGPYAPYAQSERQPIYARHIEDLKGSGAIYPCFCTRERLQELRTRQQLERETFRYDRHCRGLPAEEVRRRLDAGEPCTWRLKVEEGETVLDDLIRGRISVGHADIEDIILVRADGTPVYNLAVVIDDHTMEVTHVLRGEDHLTNAFKQLILFRAFGWEAPVYGHLPLILGPVGEGKLSKRKHPEAALEHYIAKDYHPDAVVNWLALIGWSYDDKTEIMSRQELIERFTIERINKSGARLNLEKLAAMSGEYIRRMPLDEVERRITLHLSRAGLISAHGSEEERAKVRAIARIEQERLRHFSEIVELARWAFSEVRSYDEKALKNLTKDPKVPALLRAFAAALPDPLPEPATMEAQARELATAHGAGFGQLVHPVRAAITGKSVGPPLFDAIAIVGRETAVRRLERAAAEAEGQATPA